MVVDGFDKWVVLASCVLVIGILGCKKDNSMLLAEKDRMLSEKNSVIENLRKDNRKQSDNIVELEKQIADAKVAHQREMGAVALRHEKEVAELKKEALCYGEDIQDLKEKIEKLEAEKIKLSNDAVVVINRLRARNRGGMVQNAGGSTAKTEEDAYEPCRRCNRKGTIRVSHVCVGCGGQGFSRSRSYVYRRTGAFSSSDKREHCAACGSTGKTWTTETCPACAGRGVIRK